MVKGRKRTKELTMLNKTLKDTKRKGFRGESKHIHTLNEG
jgi:hypothetical protein